MIFRRILKFFFKHLLLSKGVKINGSIYATGLMPSIKCDGEIAMDDGVSFMCRQGPRINLTSHHGASLKLGRAVFINQSATIIATIGVEIGADTKIGPHVVIHDTAYHEVDEGVGTLQAPIEIGKNAWIGRGATILPGVTIGDHSVVGSGSVVTKSVPEKTVVAGNPARVIRQIVCADNYIRP